MRNEKTKEQERQEATESLCRKVCKMPTTEFIILAEALEMSVDELANKLYDAGLIKPWKPSASGVKVW